MSPNGTRLAVVALVATTALALAAAPATGQYVQWQTTIDTAGVRWQGQTRLQAEAALAVPMATVRAGIQQALGGTPDQLGILAGSPDTAYAWAHRNYSDLQVLRSTDGGRAWTQIWSQSGYGDDDAADRAGALVVDPLSGQLWIGTSFGLYHDQVAVDQPPAACDIIALAVDPTDPHRLWVASDATALTYAGKVSGIGLFRRREEAGTVSWEDWTAGLVRGVAQIGFDSAHPGRTYLRLRGSRDVVAAQVPEAITPEQVGWTLVAAAPAATPRTTQSAAEALRVRPSYPTDLLINHTMDAHGSLAGYPLAVAGLVYARSQWWHGGMYGGGLSVSRDGGVSWRGVGGYSNFGRLAGARDLLIWDHRERIVFADNGLPGIAGQSLGPWIAHPLDAGTVYQCQIGRGHLYRTYDLSTWEDLTAGLDPMLKPKSVVVDSLSRVYLVTNRGTFVHQDPVRPYRVTSLRMVPDTLRRGDGTPAKLTVRVDAADPTQPVPVVTVVTWAGEQTVPRQADGSYVAPMPATTGLGPGCYGVTVSAAPAGASLARTSTSLPVILAPAHDLPVFAEGLDASWQAELETGTMDLASPHARTGALAQQLSGRMVFRRNGGQPIHPFGYRLEFYADAADSYLVAGLQLNGLDLASLGARRRPAGGTGTWYRIDLPAEKLLTGPAVSGSYGSTTYAPGALDSIVITAGAWGGRAVYLDDIRLVPVGLEDPPGPTAVLADVSAEPDRFQLSANYPNPFNPSTTIRYGLAQAGDVQLNVYAVSGQLVRQLVAGQQGAGTHQVDWDGREGSGATVGSGVYLAVLRAGDCRAVRRMVLMK
jgi:hypothetical protein